MNLEEISEQIENLTKMKKSDKININKEKITNELKELVENLRKGSKSLLSKETYIRFCTRKVQDSEGFKTAGLSKNRLESEKDINDMVNEIQNIILTNGKSMIKNPNKRIYIEKKDKSPRPLTIPSYRDRILQTMFMRILEILHEDRSPKRSFAYRPGRSPSWPLYLIKLEISKKNKKPEAIVCIDVKSCYDEILRPKVYERIENEYFGIIPTKILEGWLQAGYIEKGNPKIQDLDRGIYQGSPISPILANIMLDTVQWEIEENENLAFRYADDIMLIIYNEENETMDRIKDDLSKIGNRISEAKTERTKVTKTTKKVIKKYLGYKFEITDKKVRWLVPENEIERIKEKFEGKTFLEKISIGRGALNFLKHADDIHEHKRKLSEILPPPVGSGGGATKNELPVVTDAQKDSGSSNPIKVEMDIFGIPKEHPKQRPYGTYERAQKITDGILLNLISEANSNWTPNCECEFSDENGEKCKNQAVWSISDPPSPKSRKLKCVCEIHFEKALKSFPELFGTKTQIKKD